MDRRPRSVRTVYDASRYGIESLRIFVYRCCSGRLLVFADVDKGEQPERWQHANFLDLQRAFAKQGGKREIGMPPQVLRQRR